MSIHMDDGSFEVLWGPMRGDDLPEFVKVVRAEQGWLYVFPIDEHGKDAGDPFWLSPCAASGLRPFKPKP